MSNYNATQAYAKVGVESEAISASPHQLIMMLFNGALNALLRARILMKQGNIAAKGQAISKAISIISNGLQHGLDPEQGGEITEQLAMLYDYMQRRLLQANLHNDLNAIEEVISLLQNLADAWHQIGPAHPPAQERKS